MFWHKLESIIKLLSLCKGQKVYQPALKCAQTYPFWALTQFAHCYCFKLGSMLSHLEHNLYHRKVEFIYHK